MEVLYRLNHMGGFKGCFNLWVRVAVYNDISLNVLFINTDNNLHDKAEV